jgi:hypothetical protein
MVNSARLVQPEFKAQLALAQRVALGQLGLERLEQLESESKAQLVRLVDH